MNSKKIIMIGGGNAFHRAASSLTSLLKDKEEPTIMVLDDMCIPDAETIEYLKHLKENSDIIVINDKDIAHEYPLLPPDPQLLVGLPSMKYERVPQLKELFPEKKFICKGKHEYTEQEDGEWICQCGRNVND